MDFILYYDVTFDTFWMIYYISISIAFLGVLSNLTFFISPLLNRSIIGKKIKDFFEILFIVTTHFAFLPTFSMLMNIYDCRNSIGSSLQDTYLHRDCTTFCYTSHHRSIVILSTLLTTGYLAASTFSRYQCEKVQNLLNISTKVSYLSVFSVFQVVLVIINKCLKISNQSTAGLFQSFFILIMIILTIVMKPYNYKRAEIAQITALTMALWGVFLSAVIEDSELIKLLIAVEFSGFAVISLLGIVLSIKFLLFWFLKNLRSRFLNGLYSSFLIVQKYYIR
jgi:hypothetical protein